MSAIDDGDHRAAEGLLPLVDDELWRLNERWVSCSEPITRGGGKRHICQELAWGGGERFTSAGSTPTD